MKLLASCPLVKVMNSSSLSSELKELHIDAASGEVVSAQAVLIPADKADVVSAKMTTLVTADGKSSIPASAARLQWIRTMHISANTSGLPLDELVAKAPADIPDPFWEDASRPVDPSKLQPLWVEVTVPQNLSAGIYKGQLVVEGKNGSCSMPVSLRVREFSMPETRHQRVIQWWQFPGRSFSKIKFGTDEYWDFLKKMCEFVGSYRQTDVRADWDMIPRSADGKSWDTSKLEKYIDIAFNAGMKGVHLNTVGHHTKHQLEPGSTTDTDEDSMQRLAAVQALAVKRGWQGRIYTSIADEPFIVHEQTYKAVLKRVHETAPDVKVIEAIETDDIGDIDVFVPKLNHINMWWPTYQKLQDQGKDVWFYTCCHPMGRYPNRFLDQPLVEARELHWISYLYNLDGFLHWGLNWYQKGADPYTEEAAVFDGLPPGDAQVAYPGKTGWLGSMRLSAMRDGLQDYEYLWTLERRIRALKSHIGEGASWIDARQRPTELCKRVVQSFYDHTRDAQVLLDTRAAIADEIEALDASPYLYVQTNPADGSVTPEGPIMVNVRGAATPGSKVTINGEAVPATQVNADGTFIAMVFLTAEKSKITVTIEKDGVTRSVVRSFIVKE